MTFFHFINCLALAVVPFQLTYKAAALSEYGAFWRCVTSGGVYVLTQLLKMLFLATFFPDASDVSDSTWSSVLEFLRCTVDCIDIVGLNLALNNAPGKPRVRIVATALGWSFAELLLTKLLFLWVGARGIAFDWQYIEKSLESNLNLLHHLTLTSLIYLYMRRLEKQSMLPIITILLVISSYENLIMQSIVQVAQLGMWTALGYRAILGTALAFATAHIYLGVTAKDKY